MRSILIFLSLFFGLVANAQTSENSESSNSNITIVDRLESNHPGDGKIQLIHDKKIGSLLELQQLALKNEKGMEGFRVQIFRGNNGASSKKDAEAVKLRYTAQYPDKDIYLIFSNPIWRVQAGDFRTYGEALKLKADIDAAFPDLKDQIYVIQTQINFPK